MPDNGLQRVKILIASPGDVDRERKIVEELIEDWNIRNSKERNLLLEAVMWEKHAASENRGNGDGPQEVITRQIVDDCDCAIGIFWNRIGTPTKIAAGGAVEEVQRMLTVLKRPVMLFFSDTPIAPSKIDDQQKAKLKEFKAAMTRDGLIWEYDSRAKFRKLLARHLDLQIREWFCTPGAPLNKKPIPVDEVLRRYHAALREELGYIRMLGMPGVESIKVNLNDDTFVPLRLSDRPESGFHPGKLEILQRRDKVEEMLNPDEVMQRAFKKRRMLLIIGDPGAGKTTLIKYYALCALEDDHFKRLGFAAPVRVFYLPLRDLARHEKGHYDTLPANFAHWSEKQHQSIDATFFDEWLRKGTPLILLDGLDEISNTQDRIEVCKWIDAALNTFTTARFVVTSRATGYRKDEGIELAADYERADVQDFTVEQQERFLKNWFTEAFLKEPCPKEVDETEWERQQRAEAKERTRKMVAHLKEEKNKGLRQLAAIPMILQIMAILWKDRDYMPESRVKLYEASLDYLLEFRDKRRGIMPPLSAARARQVLAPLSLWMQEKLKKDEASGREMHKKMLEQLDKQDKPPSVEDFCDYLVKRAGLLVETGAHDYLFRHKSFREYLAGVQLVTKVRSTKYLGNLIAGFGQDWWEEPIRFFMAQGDEEIFNLFMKKLFDSSVSDQLSDKQQLLLQTIIEEAPLKKVDALCKKLLDLATTASRQRVILDCLKAIGKPAALEALQQFSHGGLAKDRDVADRAEEVFLALGGQISTFQSAKSVGGTMRSYRNPNEDNVQYILIPGGNYLYSVTDETVDVPDRFFAKYPVTNKLYRFFIAWLEAKEFPELRSAFTAELNAIAKSNAWGKEFTGYLKEGQEDLAGHFRSKYDEDRKYDGADQPVVGVTWYAARAYCLWLSLLEGEKGLYRLPNEVEWEWAAGGKQGTTGEKVRSYPWPEEKGEPSSILANYNENIGATTPVSNYPEGATPEGLYDMAGNVDEWMENWYDKDEDCPSLRGGCWFDKADALRCSSRGGVSPGVGVNSNVGFRVIRSSHSSSS
jgi:formylglycine-generating enzyme required for sulfatase activity